MNIIKNMTIELSEEDVRRIIADRVNSEIPEANVEAEDVDILTGIRTTDYYGGTETYLIGATVRHLNQEEY